MKTESLLDCGAAALPKFRYCERTDRTRARPEKILPLVTSNVADALGLGGKGKISAGFDADICFFDTDWKLRSVFARGKQHLSEGKLLKKGTFEEL